MEKIGMHYTEAQMKPLFDLYDKDKSGTLDYQEFATIVFGDAENLSGACFKRPDRTPQTE